MRVAGKHDCNHLSAQHRRNGWGRCTAPRCQCLFGPGPVSRPSVLDPPRRATVKTTADGIVIERTFERERLERMLWRRIEEAGLPEPSKQYLWARPERMYRSDFAYVQERILLEVQGGIWAANPGRHNRGSGYQADLTRSNLAALLGYRLLAFSEAMIKSGEAVSTIARALTPLSMSAEQVSLAP